jgi:molybdate transport system permease protein
MIGGNIRGETRVLSIALFNQVESLRYEEAHVTAMVLVALSLTALTFVYRAQRGQRLT